MGDILPFKSAKKKLQAKLEISGEMTFEEALLFFAEHWRLFYTSIRNAEKTERREFALFQQQDGSTDHPLSGVTNTIIIFTITAIPFLCLFKPITMFECAKLAWKHKDAV